MIDMLMIVLGTIALAVDIAALEQRDDAPPAATDAPPGGRYRRVGGRWVFEVGAKR
jgi:hypothetical protein